LKQLVALFFLSLSANQGLSKDLKIKDLKLDTLQGQLTSAQSENASLSKTKEDIIRQLAQKTEQVTKLLPLEATVAQLKEETESDNSSFFLFLSFFLLLFLFELEIQ
jgi:hypothetical protein